MFMALVAGHGVAPSEFWNMTISEIAIFFEAKRPRDRSDYAGNLTQGDVEEISEFMETWDK